MNEITTEDVLDDLSIKLTIARNCIAMLVVSELPPDKDKLHNSIDDIKPFFTAHCLDEEIESLKKELSETSGKRVDAVLAVLKTLINPHETPWASVVSVVERSWPNWGTGWLLAAQDALDKNDLVSASNYLKRAHENLPVQDQNLLSNLDKLRIKSNKAEEKEKEKEKEKIEEIREIGLFVNKCLVQHRPNILNFDHWASTARQLHDWDSLDLIVRKFFNSYGSGLFDENFASWVNDLRETKVDDSDSLDQIIWKFLDYHGSISPKDSPRYDEVSSLARLIGLINSWAGNRRIKDHDYLSWAELAIAILRKSLKIADIATGYRKPKNPLKTVLPRLGDFFAQALRFLPADKIEYIEWLKKDGEEIIRDMIANHPDLTYQGERQLAAIYTGEVRRAVDMGITGDALKNIIECANTAYDNCYKLAYPAKRNEAASNHFDFLVQFKQFERAAEIAADRLRKEFPPALIELYNEKPLTREIVTKLEHSLSSRRLEKEILLLIIMGIIKKIKIQDTVFSSTKIECNAARSSVKAITVEKPSITKARKVLKSTVPLISDVCRTAIKDGNINQGRAWFNALKFIKSDQWENIDWDLELDLTMTEYRNNESTSKTVLDLINRITSTADWVNDGRLIQRVLSDINTVEKDNLLVDIPVMPVEKIWGLALKWNNTKIMSLLLWYQLVSEKDIEAWPARLAYLIEIESQGNEGSYYLVNQLAESNVCLQVLVSLIEKYSDQDSIANWLIKVVGKLSYQILFGNNFGDQSLIKRIDHLPLQWGPFTRILVELQVRWALKVWNYPWQCRKRLLKTIRWIKQSFSGKQLLLAWVQLFGAARDSTMAIAIAGRQGEVQTIKDGLDQDIDKTKWVLKLDQFIKGGEKVINQDSILLKDQELKSILDYAVSSMESFDPTYPDENYWRKIKEMINKIEGRLSSDGNNKFIASFWLDFQNHLIANSLNRLNEIGSYAFHSLKNKIKNYSGNEIPETYKSDLQNTVRHTLRYLDWQYWPEMHSGVDLKLIVEEVAYQPPYNLTLKDDEQDIPLLYPIRPPTPIHIHGNESMLKEMLNTLLANALEHTPSKSKGGWIWLEVSADQDNAYIAIIDNGEGISCNILEDLNNPTATPRTTKKMGTGYGIRFSQRCTRLHGGEIRIKSKGTGTGTCVDIRLPMRRK